MAVNVDEILALDAEARISIMEAIWESLVDENVALPISIDERRELKRRYDHYLQNPETARPWAEVRERLSHGVQS